MERLKTILFSITMFGLMSSYSQCSNAQKLESASPFEFGDVYFQRKVQAVKDMESSLTLYIPIMGKKDRNIIMDSVYFKGLATNLTASPKNGDVYFGRFITKPKYTEDIILSSDMAQEHQNKLPAKEPKIPFELKSSECVVSYIQDGKIKYYKITGIKQKRLKEAPMAPRNHP